MDINVLILHGNVTQDPEARYTKDDKLWCTFSIATNYTFKDSESTEYTKVVAFGKNAEKAVAMLRKGMRIYAEGRKETSKYTDKNGNEKYDVSMILYHFISSPARQMSKDDAPF